MTSFKMKLGARLQVCEMLDKYEDAVRSYRFLVCDYAASRSGERIIDAPHTHTNLGESERKTERIAVLSNNRAYYTYNSELVIFDKEKRGYYVCSGLVKAGLA